MKRDLEIRTCSIVVGIEHSKERANHENVGVLAQHLEKLSNLTLEDRKEVRMQGRRERDRECEETAFIISRTPYSRDSALRSTPPDRLGCSKPFLPVPIRSSCI